MKTVTYDDKKWKLVPVEPTREMVEAGERVRAGFSGLPPTLYFVWPAMLSVSPEPPAAENRAEQRLNALYKVISEVVASDDRAINITRLHDYLGGEDIPASAVVCEAEPDEKSAGRVPLSEEHIDAGFFERVGEGFNGDDGALFEAGVRFAEAAHGIKGES